jgi:hypothetical protein
MESLEVVALISAIESTLLAVQQWLGGFLAFSQKPPGDAWQPGAGCRFSLRSDSEMAGSGMKFKHAVAYFSHCGRPIRILLVQKWFGSDTSNTAIGVKAGAINRQTDSTLGSYFPHIKNAIGWLSLG